jgi:hypothetical protein
MKKMNVKIFSLFICIAIYVNSNAQNLYSNNRKQYILDILSDTVGFGYIIPIYLNKGGNDSTHLYLIPNYMFYYEMQKIYKFSTSEYIDTMKEYLLNNKVFYTNDFNNFLIYPVLCTNNFYYDFSYEQIEHAFDTCDRKSAHFECLLKAMIDKNVYVAIHEEEFELGQMPDSKLRHQ